MWLFFDGGVEGGVAWYNDFKNSHWRIGIVFRKGKVILKQK